MTASSENPIHLEILKNALSAIADEMSLTVLRTAHSTIIKDGSDFATALMLPNGELLSQGLTVPQHLGSMPTALAAVIKRFEGQLEPGDIVLLNDPFNGGMHLPDVFVFKPLFDPDDSSKLIAFACAVAHHTDMGGRVPGSNAADSTEIYQEGIRFPPVKLYVRGEPNPAIFDVFAANVRVPEMVIGDLKATVAALFYGEREFLKLVQRVGLAKLQSQLNALLDYTERLTRSEIASLPQGTCEFEDWVDDDGLSDEPIRLCVALTVKDGEITVDFSGSSPQVRGALNATDSFTRACTYVALRSVFEADIPSNGGFMRVIHIITEPGSVLNVRLPGACAARGLTGFRITDVVLGALAKAVPERVMAAGEGGNTFVTWGGTDPKRGPWVHCDLIFGAWGGASYRPDGDAMALIASNCTNIPIEIIEARYPLRCEQYAFVPDTGGPGQSRGGLSIVRDMRLLSGEAVLQVRADRQKFMPWPLSGGVEGTRSWNFINPDSSAEPMPAKFTTRLRAGDLFRHVTAGGAGFGDPLARDPAHVADDVRDEKMTPEYARKHYGVVTDSRGVVDLKATEQLRAELRAARRKASKAEAAKTVN